jgi:hypothetical protein
MMAGSICSNRRPDTLMQDRISQDRRNLLHRTAGPYIRVKMRSPVQRSKVRFHQLRTSHNNSGHCWRPPRRCANNVQTRSNGIEIRSTLGHDGRGGLALALADAGAASNAYRNESRDQSDEYFFHWNSPFFHATRCTLRASLHRWSPAEANGSPAPQTVGHFKWDCVLGDTVTRRAQQNPAVSGSRSAPPTTPRLFQG